MKENPYQSSADHSESPPRPTRLEAATWGANFGAKAGVAIGGALALATFALKQMRLERVATSADMSVSIVGGFFSVVFIGVLGALLGTAIGFVTRYKPTDKNKAK